MGFSIALTGNPNCGKTTLFNALTGANQYVGNWPGVTVEKKEGAYKLDKTVLIQDLPGIYSLSPYSPEEDVARDYLLSGQPSVILNLVDASNLERNLYLSTQLRELNIPMVIALNMMDVVKKRGDQIDTAKLSKVMGCPVVEISAVNNQGVHEAVKAAKEAALKPALPPLLIYTGELKQAVDEITELFNAKTPQARFLAVKAFERDPKALQKLKLTEAEKAQLETISLRAEDALEDDAESLITSARYEYIANHVKTFLKKQYAARTPSDRIDAVVTNRFLALPIFALIMFLVYYISVTTLGATLTDWANDGLFGDGFTLFGLEIPGIPVLVESGLAALGVADWLQALILDGIVGGVGAVLGFVPQMLVLFLLLAILEDCGYMARIAFIMDRIFRRFGLSGKSFIPMLIGSGCSVPGIMASRTIESDRDRRMTIMTTSFVPCGAKMPIVALIAGAVFGGAWWVAPSAYFIGVTAIVISGILLKKTKMFRGDPAPFVMELPSYHLPKVTGVLRAMWERGWSFIKKAGTIILLSSIVVWFLKSFGVTAEGLQMVEDMDHSILAAIGNTLAPIFMPLGFGTWEASVATLLGLVAKEEVVSVFGVLYGISGDALAMVEEADFGSLSAIAAHFTVVSAYSFLVFNLLCAPCFAAIGAIRREMNSAKWTWFAIGYQTVLAYAVALMLYQFSLLLSGAGFTLATGAAALVLIVFIYLLVRRPKHNVPERALHAA